MSCRIANVNGIQSLSPSEFGSLACAQCIFFILSLRTSSIKSTPCLDGLAVCKNGTNCGCGDQHHDLYNVPEYALNGSVVQSPEELVYRDPSLNGSFVYMVHDCCKAAVSCCSDVLQHAGNTSNQECPATWDGFQCFGQSKPGKVYAMCPYYAHMAATNLEAVEKECTTEEGWRKFYGAEWSDYSGCAHTENAKFWSGVISYSASVVAITPALVIITFFRSLRTQAVFVIHRHLLLSFLFLGLTYLFTSFFFIHQDAPGHDWSNQWVCRIVFLIQLRFLRLSTFSWMLAEGVYLFRLLYKSFADSDSLLVYKIVCWGVPMVVSTLYGVMRYNHIDTLHNDNSLDCWINPLDDISIEAIVMAPSLFCLCMNLLLVCVILYILVKKLRYNPHLEPMQYRRPPLFALLQGSTRLIRPFRSESWILSRLGRPSLVFAPPLPTVLSASATTRDVIIVAKAVRAAMMLVPVFGLHFLFTIYRIQSQAHQIMNLVMDGLQGFAVSIILCYANNGVSEAVKKYIKGMKDMRSLRSECRSHSNVGLGNRISIPNGNKKMSHTETVEFTIVCPETVAEAKRASQDYRQPLMTTAEDDEEEKMTEKTV